MALNALEILMEQAIVQKSETNQGEFDFKTKLLTESNRLSLFLRLKEFYLQNFAGQSKEYESLFSYKILADKKNLKLIQGLVQKTTYLYPRLHSSLPLLLNEISNEQKPQDRMKLIQTFTQSLLDDHLLNEESYNAITKNSTKFKFIHIGLRLWELVAKKIGEWDSKLKNREQLIDMLVKPNFLKVLVKNTQNVKAHLHEAALQVKQTMITLIQSSNLNGEQSFKLMLTLFGPNANVKFSLKKN